ncbi:MAG TPA: hypothetical protein VJK30_01815 [Coxiellaceae bacterium]|nr:MAG: hypothetical protein A3E81_04135 [Gammaproteobacteria bacterium RIFCSPHIGHO2_12_FULL_36_30]HLB56056.1 hypothetical protein [Coxiellaceae bacterium]
MAKNEYLKLEFLTWKNARKYLCDINPDLTKIIDDWNPDNSFGFYKGVYQYGDLLLEEGKLCLPFSNGEFVYLTDSRISEKIKADLNYSSFPISILIQKSAEVYFEVNNRVIPLVIFPSGIPLGLLETLDPIGSCCIRNIWNVSIGARSAFMIPKISDRETHNKLAKEFNLSISKPNSSFDHFEIFKQLARSEKNSDSSWTSDILFMNRKWFETDYNNYHWLKFNNYLHEYMVRYSSYTRNKSTVDVMYQLFVKELETGNKRTFAHLFDTLKHIVSIMVGAAPSFRPARNDECAGPFNMIQKLYLEYYSLHYCPTVMVPHHYNFLNDTRPSYYSISQPSLFETALRSRKLESFIDDLYQLRLLFESFTTLAKKGKFRIDGTLIENAIKSTDVDYFHTSEDSVYNGIKSIKEMSDDDIFLSTVSIDNNVTQLKFSEISSFTRSCIRLKSTTAD